MNITDYLFDLGYKDKENVFKQNDKVSIKIPFNFNGKRINICPYIIPYLNKKSYLNVEFESFYNDSLQKKKNILNLIKNIKYPENGRVAEMGWEAEYLIDPREFTAEERARILISSFKKFRSLILNHTWLNGTDEFGNKFEISAQPGDIIVSKPIGIKFDMGFTEESEKEGTLQRSILSKKVFKFGDLKEDGMQYAIIGEDLDMHPI